MTVTREQAQLLTTLAIACRPHRAPTWDQAGVMAEIGKMRDWSLSEVALRVIVAAADREAKTPAVISKQQIPEVKPPLWQPTNKRDDEHRCTECGLLEHQCRDRQRINGEHEFVSVAANRAATARPVEALGRIVGDLHERIGGSA